MLEWSDDLAIGIPEIDDQHCAFVDLANRLDILIHRHATRGLLLEISADIIVYAALHFTEEERIMRFSGYPRIEEHREQHEAALARLREIMLSEDDDEICRSLAEFARLWLVSHIMDMDKAFGEWFGRHSSPERV